MDSFEMAKALTGKKTTEGTAERQKRTVQISGMATSDSANGTVMVDMGGAATTADDSQSIELQTTVQVKEGDIVSILLTGTDGSAKAPLVIGVVGRGDEQKKEIDSANQTANEAQETANTAESDAQNAQSKAENAQSAADGTAENLSSLQDVLYGKDGDIVNLISGLKLVTDEYNETINGDGEDSPGLKTEVKNNSSNIQSMQQVLTNYDRYVFVDPSIPALILGRRESGTRVQLTDEQLQFLVDNNVLVYLSNQRLYAPTAELTTLFFGLTDKDGNSVGKLGWVQRVSGHLSLKRLR